MATATTTQPHSSHQAYQNLLLIPGYYDIALRDFGLSLGALSLARLAVAAEATAGSPARMREARV
jgi:hypothetical protein